MAVPSRLERLSLGRPEIATAAERRLTAIHVICGAQLLMVVANLIRIPVLSAGERDIPLTINELCVVAILAAAALVVLSNRAVHLDRVSLAAGVFIAIGGGSAIWSVQRFDLTMVQLAISLAFLARWVMYFGVYVAVINVVRDAAIGSIWKALEGMLLIIAGFGIFQAAFLPGFAQMVYPDSRVYLDWDPQGHRLVSTILDPNLAGMMLAIGLLVQLGRLVMGARQPYWRILLLFVALMLTLSRGSVLGFVAGLMVVLLVRGLSRRLITLGIGGGLAVIAAAPFLVRFAASYGKLSFGAGSSAALRLEGWLETIGIIARYPVFGVGFNAFKYALVRAGIDRPGAASYGSDGGLLFVLAMTGVVGLAVYCHMLRLIYVRCRSLWRDTRLTAEHRGLALGTAASLVAVVVGSITANAIFTTFIMEMLWVLSGLTFVIAKARDQGSTHERVAPGTRVVALAA